MATLCMMLFLEACYGWAYYGLYDRVKEDSLHVGVYAAGAFFALGTGLFINIVMTIDPGFVPKNPAWE